MDRSRMAEDRRKWIPRLLLSAAFWLALVAPNDGSETKVSRAQRDQNGVLVHQVTSDFQTKTTTIRVLLPEDLQPGERCRVVYLLPVEAAAQSRYGDGLREAAKLGLHNKHNVICVAPSFSQLPWYADHPTNAGIRQETYFLKVVVPFIERTYPAIDKRSGRLLAGFSKSGWGAYSLLLRHPDTFERAAAWDAPLMMQRPGKYGNGPIFGTPKNFEAYRVTSLLRKNADRLQGKPRLVLTGYGNFRDEHVQAHTLMQELAIPHVYRDGPRKKHHWNSGWLAEAVELLVHGSDP